MDTCFAFKEPDLFCLTGNKPEISDFFRFLLDVDVFKETMI